MAHSICCVEQPVGLVLTGLKVSMSSRCMLARSRDSTIGACCFKATRSLKHQSGRLPLNRHNSQDAVDGALGKNSWG